MCATITHINAEDIEALEYTLNHCKLNRVKRMYNELINVNKYIELDFEGIQPFDVCISACKKYIVEIIPTKQVFISVQRQWNKKRDDFYIELDIAYYYYGYCFHINKKEFNYIIEAFNDVIKERTSY